RSGATWLGQVYAGAVMDEVGWPAQGPTGEGMPGGQSPASPLSPPPELLAPCIAYVEADWMLRRIQALRALVLKGTRSALDAVGVFEDAWREIVGLATRLNDEARASGGALPFCDIALSLALEAEALDAVGMLARAARAGPRRGLLLVRMPTAAPIPDDPVSRPEPASIAMAAAADLATLSGYEQRTASRARRARRTIETWRRDHQTGAPVRQGPGASRRTPEDLVAAIAAALGEPAKGDMASRRLQQESARQERARQERSLRDLAPAKDRTGLAVRALVWDGLLEDAGWALIAAAQEAVLLDHGTLSRRFIRLASIAVARHAAWRAMVFTLANIKNFGELQEIMRKRRQGEELIRQALEAFQDIEPTVRRRMEKERRREKIRANEPGDEREGGESPCAANPGTAEPGTTDPRANDFRTNEPGTDPVCADGSGANEPDTGVLPGSGSVGPRGSELPAGVPTEGTPASHPSDSYPSGPRLPEAGSPVSFSPVSATTQTDGPGDGELSLPWNAMWPGEDYVRWWLRTGAGPTGVRLNPPVPASTELTRFPEPSFPIEPPPLMDGRFTSAIPRRPPPPNPSGPRNWRDDQGQPPPGFGPLSEPSLADRLAAEEEERRARALAERRRRDNGPDDRFRALDDRIKKPPWRLP
ncbi:hypothetical protein ACX9GQ_24905, partial [Alsobacter sp. R-9]